MAYIVEAINLAQEFFHFKEGFDFWHNTFQGQIISMTEKKLGFTKDIYKIWKAAYLSQWWAMIFFPTHLESWIAMPFAFPNITGISSDRQNWESF